MYFVAPAGARVQGGAGLLIVSHEHHPIFLLGGPVEQRGRLPYIDGCTDSLLLAPPLKGDPCFNHLHFPPRTLQTQHTHPSARVGAVIRGSGVCVFVSDTGRECRTALKPGVTFVIPAHAIHAFETQEETMDVVAWHPDSDFGPANDDHPMVNRTMVRGVSAAKLPKIRTMMTAMEPAISADN
jgi:quercetin dioxygenase-like cupin family protein